METDAVIHPGTLDPNESQARGVDSIYSLAPPERVVPPEVPPEPPPKIPGPSAGRTPWTEAIAHDDDEETPNDADSIATSVDEADLVSEIMNTPNANIQFKECNVLLTDCDDNIVVMVY